MNINVSKETIEEIKKVENNDESKAIRIFLAGMSCGGPSFGLFFDEVREDDVEATAEDLKFVIDKKIADEYNDGFDIEFIDDYRGRGFAVTPVGLVTGCSSCTSCG